MMASRPTMKTRVGSRKARAVSPRPRRFSTVMKSRIPRQSGIGGAVQTREGGLQRRHPGGDGDGDGQRVVDDERRRGDQADAGPRLARETA